MYVIPRVRGHPVRKFSDYPDSRRVGAQGGLSSAGTRDDDDDDAAGFQVDSFQDKN